MKNKKQTIFVQMLAFFTAMLSVIFLRQYTQGKTHHKLQHSELSAMHLNPSPKILLESAEVKLTEEIIVTPVEN